MSRPTAGECIYCTGPAKSREHPLPACLGSFKDYPTLLNRVCRQCNSKLGLLDEQICRCGPEAFFRLWNHVQGRRGNDKVNPFYRRSAGGSRLTMTGTSSVSGERVPLELTDAGVRELRHVSFKTEDGDAHIIPIPDGMGPEDFRRECAKLGITTFREASVYADPGEMDWIAGVLGNLRIESHSADTPASPVTYSDIRIDVGVTGRYFRGIGKIAFHYLLTQVPHLSGTEAAFAPFREMLLTDGVPNNYNPYVQESRTPILFDVQRGARLAYWGHLLCIDVDYMRIRAMVQLFIGPELLPSTFLVNIGPNPSRIHADQVRGHFFWYFPTGRTRGCDGDIEPVHGVRFRQAALRRRVL